MNDNKSKDVTSSTKIMHELFDNEMAPSKEYRVSMSEEALSNSSEYDNESMVPAFSEENMAQAKKAEVGGKYRDRITVNLHQTAHTSGEEENQLMQQVLERQARQERQQGNDLKAASCLTLGGTLMPPVQQQPNMLLNDELARDFFYHS